MPSLTRGERRLRGTDFCVLRIIGAQHGAAVHIVTLRLFVAIDLDDATHAFAQRAIDLLSRSGISGRFERYEKLHITLAFLGATPESRMDSAREALRAAALKCSPFSLTLDKIGAFPSERHPRIIWIGCQDQSTGFKRCAGAVRAAFANQDWEFDKDAHAHITICRLKGPPPGRLPKLRESITMTVGELSLFKSVPAGPTTRYELIDHVRTG